MANLAYEEIEAIEQYRHAVRNVYANRNIEGELFLDLDEAFMNWRAILAVQYGSLHLVNSLEERSLNAWHYAEG